MADIKISGLPVAAAATDNDVTPQVQDGVTVKQSNLALANYMYNRLSIFTWTVVNTTLVNMQMNVGYLVKSMTPVTFILPLTDSNSGSMEILGTGRTTWSISANPGQYLQCNGISTTVGAGTVDSLTSTDGARIIYGGDNSGEFNIFPIGGMALSFS